VVVAAAALLYRQRQAPARRRRLLAAAPVLLVFALLPLLFSPASEPAKVVSATNFPWLSNFVVGPKLG